MIRGALFSGFFVFLAACSGNGASSSLSPVSPAVSSSSTPEMGISAFFSQTGKASDTSDTSSAIPVITWNACLLLADTEEERRVGLSGRASLSGFDGMLFEFTEKSRYSFWMKDTLLDLELLPVAEDHTVSAPLAMRTCPDGNCPFYTPVLPYSRAVELPAGTLAVQGIFPGQADVYFEKGEESCG